MARPIIGGVVAAAVFASVASGVCAGAAMAPGIHAVSVSRSGAPAGGDEPDISVDGRYVAFSSASSALVAGDTNRARDVFLRDMVRRTTRRVSVPTNGGQISGDQHAGASSPTVSDDGRFVAFASASPALVPGDTNVERYCEDEGACDTEPASDVFVRDTISGTTRRVSVSSAERQANRASELPAISPNGRFVLFTSRATNLVRHDRNRLGDLFVRDRRHGTTQLVDVSSRGRQANEETYAGTISATGRYVAFVSRASTLVRGDRGRTPDLFIRDLRRGRTRRIPTGIKPIIDLWHSELSDNGRHLATRINGHIFVIDLRKHTTVQADVSPTGANADQISLMPKLSANGRYVTFTSSASNLVAEPDANGYPADVFVRDLQRGQTRRITINATGAQANDYSEYPVLSGDGRYVAFDSSASNLVDSDTNRKLDVFRSGPLH